MFAKLKALLRKAAARTREALWRTIGHLLGTFTPIECRNYLANSGYEFTQSKNALIAGTLTVGVTGAAYSQTIPPALVGHSYEQKLSEARWWTMEIQPTKLLFTAMGGEKKGQVVLTVDNPKVSQIGDDLYLFQWQEENKATAVHILDLKNGLEHFSSTRPDLTFVVLEGTVKLVK